jgi:hypothetical protein
VLLRSGRAESAIDRGPRDAVRSECDTSYEGGGRAPLAHGRTMAVAVGASAALTGPPLALLFTGAHLANDAFTNILPVYLPTL